MLETQDHGHGGEEGMPEHQYVLTQFRCPSNRASASWSTLS